MNFNDYLDQLFYEADEVPTYTGDFCSEDQIRLSWLFLEMPANAEELEVLLSNCLSEAFGASSTKTLPSVFLQSSFSSGSLTTSITSDKLNDMALEMTQRWVDEAIEDKARECGVENPFNPNDPTFSCDDFLSRTEELIDSTPSMKW